MDDLIYLATDVLPLFPMQCYLTGASATGPVTVNDVSRDGSIDSLIHLVLLSRLTVNRN